MYHVPELPLEPLFLVDFDRDRSVSAIGAAATTCAITVGKMRAPLHDIDDAPVGARDALTIRGHHY
jgi:hypothetical protein